MINFKKYLIFAAPPLLLAFAFFYCVNIYGFKNLKNSLKEIISAKEALAARGAPPPPPPLNGSCGSTLNTCGSGSFSDTTDSSTQYLWRCVGSNGGSTASCSTSKLINGVCGSAKNVCDAGSFSDIVDSDTSFRWQCLGVNGGSSASCSSSLMTTPTNFRAIGAGCRMVNNKNTGVIGLTWNLIDRVDRYEIIRLGSSPGNIRAVINLKGNQNNYTDKFGTGSNIWQGYELRACNNVIGCSPFSDKILALSPNCK